ncbi:hypothetical protein Mapa_017337 [Marchantia paleacea]|nr:hypothetical protein Mapa_017337 [Marchantia paleacea]
MEVSIKGVLNLPPKVAEFGSRVGKSEKSEKVKVGKGEKADKPEKPEKASKGSKGDKGDKGDPFSYLLVSNFPGFIGTYWWENLEGLLPEQRAELERIKLEAGKVEKEEIKVPVPIIPDPEPEPEPGSQAACWKEVRKIINDNYDEEQKALQAEEETRKAEKEEERRMWELRERLLCCDKSITEEDEWEIFREKGDKDPEPVVAQPTERLSIKWPDAPFPNIKRFLPGRAAIDMLSGIRMGSKFRGELARYLKPPTDLFDPSFEKYRGCFFLDLSGFLEEGVTCVDVEVPFEQFTLSGTDHGITFCQAPPKPSGKKAPKVVEDDDPLPESVDPENVLPNNSWQVSKAVVLMQIRTNRPLQPVWKPPPQPDMTLEEVIPARKKAHTVYDAVKLATLNFGEFVTTAADDLIDMYQELTNKKARKEESEDDHSLSPKSSKRSKRENKEKEEIKDVERLRCLADEYEASEDYVNAYRCHQERLKGDNMKSADLWFEFGCFCMRVSRSLYRKMECGENTFVPLSFCFWSALRSYTCTLDEALSHGN